MCEPLTIASLAVMGAGTAISANAAMQRGAAASKVAKENAQMAEWQAADATQRGVLRASRIAMRGGQLLSAQDVHYGASGVVVGAGSAGDLKAATAFSISLEEETARNDAWRESFGYQTRAGRYYQEASIAEAEASNEVAASVIGGVGKMMSIGAQAWTERPSSDTMGSAWLSDHPAPGGGS